METRLERPTFQMPVGPDGWFIDTGQYDFIHEAHVREWMARFAEYADALGAGNGRLYDPFGRYLCGGFLNDEIQSCNKYQPGEENYEVGKCVVFGDSPISGPRGSCNWWENFAGKIDPEPWASPNSAQPRDGVYVEDPTGQGFGCSPRCPHGSKAKSPDPQGRDIFCRFFGVHVQHKACCGFNGRNPLITFVNNKPVIPEFNEGLKTLGL